MILSAASQVKLTEVSSSACVNRGA